LLALFVVVVVVVLFKFRVEFLAVNNMTKTSALMKIVGAHPADV